MQSLQFSGSGCAVGDKPLLQGPVLGGMVLMMYNVVLTIRAGRSEDAAIPALAAHA